MIRADLIRNRSSKTGTLILYQILQREKQGQTQTKIFSEHSFASTKLVIKLAGTEPTFSI